MTKVVHSWWAQLARRASNACGAAHALKQRDDTWVVPERSGAGRKESRFFPLWQGKLPAAIGKRHQFLRQLGPDWHEPGFIEFGVANGNDSLREINIAHG